MYNLYYISNSEKITSTEYEIKIKERKKEIIFHIMKYLKTTFVCKQF